MRRLLVTFVFAFSVVLGCSEARPQQPASDEVFSQSKITDVQYVQQRLRQGLDVEAKNNTLYNQDHLLTYAVRHGAVDTVRVLLTAGAHVDVRSVGLSKTPLFQAAYDGRYEIAEMLIAHGADVNAVDALGNNPLREAILGNTPELVALLLQAGGDLEHRNDDGESMADIAREQGSSEIVALIEGDS